MARYGSITVNEKLLLAPSWLSGIFSFLVAFLAVGLPLLSTKYGSFFHDFHPVYPAGFTEATGSISNYIANNPYLSNLPLFVFWGLIGLASYFVVSVIVEGYHSAQDVSDELGYVNADKKSIEEEVAVHLGIRVLALILWWIVSHYLLYTVTPYAIVAGHVSGEQMASLHDWKRTVLAGIGVFLLIHCLIVLLRLIALRPRLFGSITEGDDG